MLGFIAFGFSLAFFPRTTWMDAVVVVVDGEDILPGEMHFLGSKRCLFCFVLSA